MRTSLFTLVFLASACVVEARPAPPPRVLPAPEAVSIAARYARSRGLVVDVTQAAWLDRRTRWHVDLLGAGGRDHAAVVLDGFSGRVLAARLRGPRGEYVPPPAPGVEPEPAPEPNAPPPPPGNPPPPPPPAS
ncbi:MAG TPA: hypothetical protein VLV17_06105 [Anaeromyxobacteraceae bacterium]|nr:hypothetical protein [Anaeromyxobacteraceae bacterium]